MMLVWDTGSSYGLKPFRSDFIDYIECDITVKDTTKVNGVIRITTHLNKFIESNVHDIFLPCISYHLTQTYVQPLLPQNYHQMLGSHSVLHGNQVTMPLPFNRIHIPVDISGTNLQLVNNSYVTEHKNRSISPQMRSALAYSRLSKLDIFGDLNKIQSLRDMDISREQMKINHEFEHHYANFCGTCVGAPSN